MQLQNRDFWRNIALDNQGLTHNWPHQDSAENIIKSLGYIQIDTLSVVERAHHHCLWNRADTYQGNELDILLDERKIFEHWHHALSYLPTDHYRFAMPFMERMRKGETPYYKNRDYDLMNEIIERIKSDGPLKLRDLKGKPRTGSKGEWSTRPAKVALEILFLQGDLMVQSRHKMERVFDLRENILPSDVNTKTPSLSEYANHLIDITLHANGFASLKYILHGKSTAALKAQTQKELSKRIRSGELTCHETSFMEPIYAFSDLEEAPTPEQNIRILSPFDNAIINRDRAAELFDFDYKLECYVPAAKRKFGYFCLPILYGNQIVGRMDCKVDRKAKVLNLLHIHVEKELPDMDAFFAAFEAEVQRFKTFNKCEEVRVEKVSPDKFGESLKASSK